MEAKDGVLAKEGVLTKEGVGEKAGALEKEALVEAGKVLYDVGGREGTSAATGFLPRTRRPVGRGGGELEPTVITSSLPFPLSSLSCDSRLSSQIVLPPCTDDARDEGPESTLTCASRSRIDAENEEMGSPMSSGGEVMAGVEDWSESAGEVM